MGMVDTELLIETYLQTSGTALYNQVADRVHATPPGLPHALEPVKAVSFSITGAGEVAPIANEQTPLVDIIGWAGHPKQAKAVGRAIHDTIHGVKDAEVTLSGNVYRIFLIRRVTPIQTIQDPQSTNAKWWMSFASYTIRHSISILP